MTSDVVRGGLRPDKRGEGRRGTLGGAVLAVLLVMILAAAAIAPAVGQLIGANWLNWAGVISAVVGVLILLALRLPPVEDRFGRQVLEAAAVLFSAVRRYLDLTDKEARERAEEDARRAEVLRDNVALLANLRQVICLNELKPIPAGVIADIEQNDHERLSVNDVIERIVDDVLPVDGATGHERSDRVIALKLLYWDAHPGLDENENLWSSDKSRAVPVLRDALLCTQHVQRTGAPVGLVEHELNGLHELFSTATLLDRLHEIPTTVVGRMRRLLALYPIDEISESDWLEIAYGVGARTTDEVEDCAELCAEKLKDTDPPVSAGLLHLMYLERFSPSNEGYWANHGRRLVLELAALLAESELLPEHATAFHDAPTLEALLVHHRSYSLPALRAELDALQRLHDAVEEYAVYLEKVEGCPRPKQFVPPKGELRDHVLESIVASLPGRLPRTELGVARIANPLAESLVLRDYGVEAFESKARCATWSVELGVSTASSDSEREALLQGIGIAALRVYACEKHRARPEIRATLACLARKGGAEQAAWMLVARTLMAKRDSQARFVDVVDDWVDVLEAERIRNSTKLEAQIERVREELATEIKPAAHRAADGEVAQQMTDFLDRLESEFADHASTSDAEDWLVRPYLITFDERTGPLADLLESLTNPTSAQSSLLESLGVQLRVGDRNTYRFSNFTRQARLGFLPRYMRFDEFLAQFEHDLNRVIEHRLEVLRAGGYELVPPNQPTLLDLDGAPPLTFLTMPGHGMCSLLLDNQHLGYAPAREYRGNDGFLFRDSTDRIHQARLMVRPDLDRVEVSLSRLDLAGLGELVVNHDGAESLMRRPSVENVIDALQARGLLEPVELAILHRHLGQITGCHVN